MKHKLTPADEEAARQEAEELWGPLEAEDVTVTKVPLTERVKMGVARALYHAETDITYALKIGRFKDRPSGHER